MPQQMIEQSIVHIVDDDESLRRAVGSLCRSVGFETRTYGSAQEFLDLADAVILHENKAQEFVWSETLMKPVAGRPLFRISPPQYVTPQIVEFVREKLRKTSPQGSQTNAEQLP